MDIGGLVPADREVEGVVEMLPDATQRYDQPLTDERLFACHAALFPTGRSGMTKNTMGDWRPEEQGPMQVDHGQVRAGNVHNQDAETRRGATSNQTSLHEVRGEHG